MYNNNHPVLYMHRAISTFAAFILYMHCSCVSGTGYVQLSGLKIDFSSDVEQLEKPKKKRKKVSGDGILAEIR